MDEAESGISNKLKEKQPKSQQNEEEGLIWQNLPAAKEFNTEFLENTGVVRWIGCLRVYSTLLDT